MIALAEAEPVLVVVVTLEVLTVVALLFVAAVLVVVACWVLFVWATELELAAELLDAAGVVTVCCWLLLVWATDCCELLWAAELVVAVLFVATLLEEELSSWLGVFVGLTIVNVIMWHQDYYLNEENQLKLQNFEQ